MLCLTCNGRGAIVLAVAGLAFGAASGCSSDEDSPTAVRLRAIGGLYASLAARDKNLTGPTSDGQFRTYVRNVDSETLGAYRIPPIDNRDDLFISQRDGESFVIVTGVSIRGMSQSSAPVVAYESTGEGGKRYVAYANSTVEELDADEFDAAIARAR